MSARPPLLLCVLDGFGEGAPGPGNAILAAQPRCWLDLRQKWPTALLEASGEHVGLPCGLMGNSEVGHLNIGAGRVVYQEITRIDREIREGRFLVDLKLDGQVPPGMRRGQAVDLRLELGGSSQALLVANGPFYQDTGGNWAFVLDADGHNIEAVCHRPE